VLRGEATNTNFIVFGLTKPGHEPTIYHTRGEHANHYATDASSSIWVQLKSHLRWCCEVVLPEVKSVTWPEVTSVTWPEMTMSGSMFCACATGSCAIFSLVGSWTEVTKSCDRKRRCAEVFLTGSRFCACPAFSRAFFLVVVVVTWLPDVTQKSLDPLGVPLSVRNRKLRNTCIDRRSRDPLEVSLGCSLRRPRPITLGNPASYI
jgi:hypothetical protein